VCGVCIARQRRTALTRRRGCAPPGERSSRESLTQDSRSAVKARPCDPLRESFGGRRCARRKAGVMAAPGGHHVRRSPRSREETPLISAPIVVCARTSLAVTTRAGSAMRVLRPHATSCARARWLAAHEWREGLAQHAPPVGGNLRVVARVKAGGACGVLQAPWPRCQRSRQRSARRSPPCRRGRA